MDFISCYHNSKSLLMEGALGERIKREYQLSFDENVAMAGLIYDKRGKEALSNLWNGYINIAKQYNLPFLATTPTRRANVERVHKSNFNSLIMKDNVEFLKEVREKSKYQNMYVGGLLGCKGDAYFADEILSVSEAKQFHSWQVELFQQVGVDYLFAGIMPAVSESIGMAEAMGETEIPYIISFMIKKNGRLIDGTTINDAITMIDSSVINKPICYMTNCVHPKVLSEALSHDFNKTSVVKDRFNGIQANTSPLSPEELNNAIDLKCADPIALGRDIMELTQIFDTKIVGGCCGTDDRHMEVIARNLYT